MGGQCRRAIGPDRAGSTLRLFFAVWPPAETAEALHRWARSVREQAGGRAIGPRAIHLTIAFLGAVPGSRLEAVFASARRVSAGAHSLALETATQVARRALVWAGPAQTPPQLAALANALAAELRLEGFELQHRAFLAHVTLLRNAASGVVLPELPALEWPVTDFALVQSRPGSGPAHYEILARFPLASGERGGAGPRPSKTRASAGQ